MISVLAFILGCAVTAALTGTAVSALVAGVLVITRPLLERMTPAKRADLTFMFATAPAALAFAVVVAAAAPSLASALALAPDHCPAHSHHVHLCIVHSAGLRPVSVPRTVDVRIRAESRLVLHVLDGDGGASRLLFGSMVNLIKLERLPPWSAAMTRRGE